MATVTFQRGLTNLHFYKQYVRETIIKKSFTFIFNLRQYDKKSGESLEFQFALPI